ncbi:MAG: hypothetical protein QF745_07845 [Planctomycetota bacterium]|jgi:hypothetical protein|nr:hypothetical protein [Planctomycetota bacterium]
MDCAATLPFSALFLVGTLLGLPLNLALLRLRIAVPKGCLSTFAASELTPISTRGHFKTSFAESSSVKGLDFIGLLTGVETSGMGYEMTSKLIAITAASMPNINRFIDTPAFQEKEKKPLPDSLLLADCLSYFDCYRTIAV